MHSRPLRACALALLIAGGCTPGERDATSGHDTQRARADTGEISTHEMSEALSGDVRAADRELASLQDSIYLFLGDSLSTLLKQARTRWEEYRKVECDAVRLAFAAGTMAPVAQMECWVELTDDRRRFLVEQYDYMRPARSTTTSGAR